MVDPLPVADWEQNQRIADLSKKFALVCNELNVPYLDIVPNSRNLNIWLDEARVNDSYHPRTAGYQ
jgi:lysophospholipase L1-like esterase